MWGLSLAALGLAGFALPRRPRFCSDIDFISLETWGPSPSRGKFDKLTKLTSMGQINRYNALCIVYVCCGSFFCEKIVLKSTLKF